MSRGVGVAQFAEVELHEQRERDQHMLLSLIDYSLREWEEEAFDSMREWLEGHSSRVLSKKQREIVEAVCAREGVNPVPERLRKPVPRGKEVPLAPVLRSLPMKPPGRR